MLNYILGVHCYRISPGVDGPAYSLEALRLIDKVLGIHGEFDKLLVLGGWDDPELGPENTLGHITRDALVDADPTLKDKIILPWDILPEVGGDRRMPARDGFEEVRIHFEMLQTLHVRREFDPNDCHIHFVASWHHIPSFLLAYWRQGEAAGYPCLGDIRPRPIFVDIDERRVIGQARAMERFMLLSPYAFEEQQAKHRDKRTIAKEGFYT